MNHLPSSIHRIVALACLSLALPFAAADTLTMRQTPPLTEAEKALVQTRTSEFKPSPSLVKALKLEAVEPPSDPLKALQRLPPAVHQATLDALNGLDASVQTTDFDRAWVIAQQAAALAMLNRRPEAIALFERLQVMPHTDGQERVAGIVMNWMGRGDQAGACPQGSRLTGEGRDSPEYPPLASRFAFDSWVWTWLDVQSNGRVSGATVTSSSRIVFEQPAQDWLKTRILVDAQGKPPGRPCVLRMKLAFEADAPAQKKRGVIRDDPYYDMRSIGVARSVAAAPSAASAAR